MKKTYIVDKSTGSKYPLELCSFYGKTLETAEVYYDSQDEWNDTKLLKSGEWEYLEEKIVLTSNNSFEMFSLKLEEYNELKQDLIYECNEEVVKILGKEPKFDYSNANIPDTDNDNWEKYVDIRSTFKTDEPDFEGVKQFGINPDEFLQFTIKLLEYRDKRYSLHNKLLNEKLTELNNTFGKF
jgi:hypothetical protein